MITIYAEKFDVGVKIAAALSGFDFDGKRVTMANVEALKPRLNKEVKRKGAIFIKYKGEDYAVTWGQGHMCTLKQAKDYNEEYANWSKIPLPYFPSEYEIKVKDGIDYTTRKPTGKPDVWTVAQLKVIKKLFDSSEYIINATDDDREGELIFAYVYEYLGCTTPYKRVKLDSQTESGFKKAFEHLIDADKVKPVEDAGRCRSIGDWITGANISSKMTLKYNKYLPDLSMITIGRIQTVVLDFIVEREKAINEFKSHPFWNITAEFKTASGDTYKAKHEKSQIENKVEADTIIKKISGKQGTIVNREVSPIKKEVPLLYNLPNLSREANKRFGFTAAQTLSIAQSLYEAGYISYPRTESECLTDDMMPEVDEILEMLKSVDPEYAKLIDSVSTRNYTKRHFNTKEVESHYAIIPTTEKPGKLSFDQQSLYDLIARSLIKIIFKPARGEKTNIVTEVEGETFKSSGTVIVDPQWLIVEKGTIDKDLLPMVNTGNIVDGEYSIKEGKTEPPKRYTDASLLLAMQTASKSIDDEELKKILVSKNKGGIGRPSTQGPIIENVVKKYCKREGKQIVPTKSAMKIIEILPVAELKSPELTADWEMKLDKVEEGKISKEEFLNDMEQAVKEWCEIIDNDKIKLEIPEGIDGMTSYKCPKCGAPMRKYSWGWACSAYSKDEDSCKFAVGYKMGGASFTDKDIEELLTNKRTSKIIHGFKKKDSEETYSAYVIIDDNGNLGRSWETPYKCPKCGKPINIGTKSWGCSGWKDGCDFTIWNTIAGRTITDKEKEQLLTKGKTGVLNGFSKKDGTKFSAALTVEDGKVTFTRGNNSSSVDSSLKCPICGKPIQKNSKAWGCSGWKDGCKFTIWNTIAGKTLTDKNKEDLIKKGKTGLIKGFTSQDGNKFEAFLVIKDNKVTFEFPENK